MIITLRNQSLRNLLVLPMILLIGCTSCKKAEKKVEKIEIVKQYYKVLADSNVEGIAALLTDSLLTRETEYDYEQTFSLDQYEEWIKWDAVFEPTYEILEIEQKGETVKTRISKMGNRIQFLHKGPIVTDHIIRFDKDKIASIETTKYVVFNDSIFVRNREVFLGWIDKNHPELNGFIYDQTREGALKYVKAMELYKMGNMEKP